MRDDHRGFCVRLRKCMFAEQVKTDWDRSANFGQYRSYSWERVSTRDPLMVDRIKSAVNAVLASKGGQKCHPARALLSSQSNNAQSATAGHLRRWFRGWLVLAGVRRRWRRHYDR